jgi:hypothetical protein
MSKRLFSTLIKNAKKPTLSQSKDKILKLLSKKERQKDIKSKINTDN